MAERPTPTSQPLDSAPRRLGRTATTLLGIYCGALAIILAYLVVVLFPPKVNCDPKDPCVTTVVLIGARTFIGEPRSFDLPLEVRLILLVMAVGGLGSYVHAATSFADFTGNRRLMSSWVWWYLLRPLIGMALAVVFYFGIRGGLLSSAAGPENISPFGISAIAGLVGMFSKQATDKLRELFDTLFKTEKADERADKLERPAPTIESIDPPTVTVGSGDVSVTVTGSGFLAASVVQANGADRTTEFVNATRLTAHFSAADFAAPGTIEVTVVNPGPGGGTSKPLPLSVAPKT